MGVMVDVDSTVKDDRQKRREVLQVIEHGLAWLMLLSAAVGFVASMGFFSAENPVVRQYCGIAAIVAVVVFLLAWGAYGVYNRARNS